MIYKTQSFPTMSISYLWHQTFYLPLCSKIHSSASLDWSQPPLTMRTRRCLYTWFIHLKREIPHGAHCSLRQASWPGRLGLQLQGCSARWCRVVAAASRALTSWTQQEAEKANWGWHVTLHCKVWSQRSTSSSKATPPDFPKQHGQLGTPYLGSWAYRRHSRSNPTVLF